MTSYPRVAFVASPDPGATVRLNLNDPIGSAGCTVNADGFSLGAPTLDGDPLAVGQVWGTRTATITPRLTGAKADVLAALTLLAREQLRAENWLMFQLTASTPERWLRLYPSQPQPLSLDEVYTDGRLPDAWTTTLTLLADAFMLEDWVVLGPYTISHSAAGAPYPMGKLLPTITGDAPTPLRVDLAPNHAAGVNSRWLVASLSGTSDMVAPVVEIGSSDGFTTTGGATSAGISNITYFGGSYRDNDLLASPIDSGGNLQGPLGAVPPGRYKVMLRYDADGTAGPLTYAFRLIQYDVSLGTGAVVVGDVVTEVVGTAITPYGGSPGANTDAGGWVDLGDFTFPFSMSAPPDVAATAPTGNVLLSIACFDGATHVRIDAFRLIPLSGPTVDSVSLMKTKHPSAVLQTSVTGTFDGDLEAYWSVNAGGVFLNGAPELHGGFPTADPASDQNVVIVMPTFTGDSLPSGPYVTDYQSHVDMTVSYRPRKLHL